MNFYNFVNFIYFLIYLLIFTMHQLHDGIVFVLFHDEFLSILIFFISLIRWKIIVKACVPLIPQVRLIYRPALNEFRDGTSFLARL